MNEENYAKLLYQKIWKTKGTRFIAQKRLETVGQLSTWAIALNSVYVIIISLLSLKPFSNYSKLPPEYISLIAIFFSLIILVLSLIENSKNYKSKADSFHQCGKDLSYQYEKLIQIMDKYGKEVGVTEQIYAIGLSYQNILDKYPINHLTIDYDLFLSSEKELGGSELKAWCTNLKVWLTVYVPYILAIVVPLILILMIVKLPENTL